MAAKLVLCEQGGSQQQQNAVALCWESAPITDDAMSPSPPPTPAASATHMQKKLETMLAYPFDCTLTFEAYEQVSATAAAAAPPPACWP